MPPFWYMGFLVFAILLTGCSSQRVAERTALTSNVTDCLVRETQAIAPQPIDLDTATSAVLARCDYPGVLERSLVAQYPGHAEYVHETMQKQYPGIVDMVRGGIAKLRTQ
jgi:hypothetical protein